MIDHKYFKVLIQPSDIPWNKMLKVLDCIGLWHYSRTIPDMRSYRITTTVDGDMTIVCLRTRTYFRIDRLWFAGFRYTDEQGSPHEKRTSEGQLYSAFSYINCLIEIGAIRYCWATHFIDILFQRTKR